MNGKTVRSITGLASAFALIIFTGNILVQASKAPQNLIWLLELTLIWTTFFFLVLVNTPVSKLIAGFAYLGLVVIWFHQVQESGLEQYRNNAHLLMIILVHFAVLLWQYHQTTDSKLRKRGERNGK